MLSSHQLQLYPYPHRYAYHNIDRSLAFIYIEWINIICPMSHKEQYFRHRIDWNTFQMTLNQRQRAWRQPQTKCYLIQRGSIFFRIMKTEWRKEERNEQKKEWKNKKE